MQYESAVYSDLTAMAKVNFLSKVGQTARSMSQKNNIPFPYENAIYVTYRAIIGDI